MDPSASSDFDIFDKIIVNLYQYIGIPLYILANLGNVLIGWIFLSQKSWRKNVCVFYFLVCLVVDSININSSMLGSILINGFKIDLTDSSLILCKVFNYITLFLSTLSPTILVLASIDRLLISSQNVQTRLYSSKRLAYFSISISTTVWFIFFFHVLINFDIVQFGPILSLCAFDFDGFYHDFLAYSMLMINVILFLTMIILLFLSFKNVRRIRSIPRQQRENIRTMHKKDFQLLRCLFAKDMIYIICSSLLTGYTIYETLTKYQIRTVWEQERQIFIFNLGTLIHHIPFCLSFFIYLIVSKAFRQGLKRLIWKILGKDSAPVREEEQEVRTDNVELNAVSTIMLTA